MKSAKWKMEIARVRDQGSGVREGKIVRSKNGIMQEGRPRPPNPSPRPPFFLLPPNRCLLARNPHPEYRIQRAGVKRTDNRSNAAEAGRAEAEVVRWQSGFCVVPRGIVA